MDILHLIDRLEDSPAALARIGDPVIDSGQIGIVIDAKSGALYGCVRVPQSIDIDEAGKWVPGAIEERYQSLWDDACRWWDATIAGKEEPDGGV